MNINNQVKVRLTAAGKKVLGEHYARHWAKTPMADADEYFEFPLWEWAQIFGPALYMGMTDTLFEENNIHVNIKDSFFATKVDAFDMVASGTATGTSVMYDEWSSIAGLPLVGIAARLPAMAAREALQVAQMSKEDLWV